MMLLVNNETMLTKKWNVLKNERRIDKKLIVD